MRTDLQPEAKALAVPTRNRIFRYLAEATRPAGVAELTSYLGLNHNAIRQHLAVLVEVGLVTEDTEDRRTGTRGRPRLLYRLNPEAAGLWDTPGPYEYLAGLFASALESGLSPRQAGKEAGHEAAVDLDPLGGPLDALEEEMQRRGFQPRRAVKGTKVDFVLGRCPFENVATTNPGAVCQLHWGLAEGLAEGLGGLEVVNLVVKDARHAGCRVAVQLRADDDA
jgi:predicted ArsR family transcriptional regulator